jgi:hypothetical protein
MVRVTKIGPPLTARGSVRHHREQRRAGAVHYVAVQLAFETKGLKPDSRCIGSRAGSPGAFKLQGRFGQKPPEQCNRSKYAFQPV